MLARNRGARARLRIANRSALKLSGGMWEVGARRFRRALPRLRNDAETTANANRHRRLTFALPRARFTRRIARGGKKFPRSRGTTRERRAVKGARHPPPSADFSLFHLLVLLFIPCAPSNLASRSVFLPLVAAMLLRTLFARRHE